MEATRRFFLSILEKRQQTPTFLNHRHSQGVMTRRGYPLKKEKGNIFFRAKNDFHCVK
jgi:hypothetical protein